MGESARFKNGHARVETFKIRQPPRPDIFVWGGDLPRAKKFGMSFATQGNQIVWGGIPQIFGGISWGCPQSLRKKFVFNFRGPIKKASVSGGGGFLKQVCSKKS